MRLSEEDSMDQARKIRWVTVDKVLGKAITQAEIPYPACPEDQPEDSIKEKEETITLGLCDS